jgi:hypothetical protein
LIYDLSFIYVCLCGLDLLLVKQMSKLLVWPQAHHISGETTTMRLENVREEGGNERLY